MSQLDISIFYSHLFGLLLTFYIFSHFVILILVNYFYNNKLRLINKELESSIDNKTNNIEILEKLLN